MRPAIRPCAVANTPKVTPVRVSTRLTATLTAESYFFLTNLGQFGSMRRKVLSRRT